MWEELHSLVPLILVMAALLAVLWYGRRRPAHRKKEPRPRGDERSLTERQRLTRAIGKLEVNLMEFGREIEGRLDTRIHTLNELIRSADERIERLEELAGRERPVGDEVPPLHREVYRMADEGLDKVEIARRTSTTPGEVELILGLRRSREG